MSKLYHVIVTVNRTGFYVYMTDKPCTERQGLTIISKLAVYPWRTNSLKEVTA